MLRQKNSAYTIITVNVKCFLKQIFMTSQVGFHMVDSLFQMPKESSCLDVEYQTNNVSLIFFNNLKYELEETLGLKVDLVHGQWRMELLVEHQIQLLVLMKHVHVLKS